MATYSVLHRDHHAPISIEADYYALDEHGFTFKERSKDQPPPSSFDPTVAYVPVHGVIAVLFHG